MSWLDEIFVRYDAFTIALLTSSAMLASWALGWRMGQWIERRGIVE